jgi:hypothetical protein
LLVSQEGIDLGHTPCRFSQSVPASQVLGRVVKVQIVFENGHESGWDSAYNVIHHADIVDSLADAVGLFQSLMDQARFQVEVFVRFMANTEETG